ncbi:MAG: glycosyl hydrolase 53 family protein [Mariniphaga sp.]|nr:glycosyl hydrolase 53 family protein [Mariniphaga sp.]
MKKQSITTGLIFILVILGLTSFQTLKAQTYAVGADLSFLKQAEDDGIEFKENGEAKPGLEIFKDHGYNWIRLRLFHTPTRLPNSLEYTIALAIEAKEMGFKFLLDYHYSDTWADPGKQFLPVAWEEFSHEELVEAVYEYTKETMIAFREAGAFPDMVQVGNEISNGMLWPDGKLPENWDNFAELQQAGINGVYAGCENTPAPKIMVHIDKGGNWEFTKKWFDKFHTYKIDYDIIGQSYYPWWHGSLLDLRECLNFTAELYKKDIIVVEAAYNWTPREYVDKLAPFPETPEGQKEFWDEVNKVILSVPDNRGVGVYWWEPATSRRGTRSFFDDNKNVLPVITVFDKYTRK